MYFLTSRKNFTSYICEFTNFHFPRNELIHMEGQGMEMQSLFRALSDLPFYSSFLTACLIADVPWLLRVRTTSHGWESA